MLRRLASSRAAALILGPILLVAGSMLAASERGRFGVDYHSMDALDASDYNHHFAQDQQGTLWVANAGALLAWDGARWKVHHHPDRRQGFHRVVLGESRIYTAVTGDLGWFERESSGALRWFSALELLPAEARETGRVLGPCGAHGDVWFVTASHLVRLGRGDGIDTMPTAGLAPVLACDDAGAWLHDATRGLLRAQHRNGRLRIDPVPGGDTTLGLRVVDLQVGPSGELLLVAFPGGVKRFRPEAGVLEAFHAEALTRLDAAVPYQTLRLRDGSTAVGYLRGGVATVTEQGRLDERYSPADGYALGSVTALFEDREGGLWAAAPNALVRIERGMGLSSFGALDGIAEAQALERHQGHLFAIGSSGLHRLHPGTLGGPARFVPVATEHFSGGSDLRSVAPYLIVSGGSGVWRLRLDKDGSPVEVAKIPGTQGMRRLAESRRHPNRLYTVASNGTLFIIDGANESVPRVRTVEGLPGAPTRLGVDADERVWVGSKDGRLVRIAPDVEPPTLWVFDSSDGVPVSGEVHPESLREDVVFLSSQGTMRFDRHATRFVLDPQLQVPMASGGPDVFRMRQDADGWIWTRGPASLGVFRPGVSGFQYQRTPLHWVNGGPTVHGFLREKDVVWLARSSGVVRVDLESPTPQVVRPYVNGIIDLASHRPLPLPPRTGELALPAKVRDLAFDVSLPQMRHGSSPEYRFRLRGHDVNWSEWTRTPRQNYTNLRTGTYRFDLEARDAFGRRSAAEPLIFEVSPLWWETRSSMAAASLAMLLLLAAAGTLGSRIRQRSLLRRQHQLEAVVEHRTRELAEFNTLLQQQAERLREADALKSRFFTNVGHEFRTPLSLVLGPLDDVLGDGRVRLGQRTRELIELARRNAGRVLDLIGELLDVNRMEHGQLPMKPRRADLGWFLTECMAELEPLALRHGQHLRLDNRATECEADFDAAQIERCLINLVGNAAKFGRRDATITLRLMTEAEVATIEVEDHGIGIAAQHLPHVFDRFWQAPERSGVDGLGVGLALVREIVEAHGGTVEVRSRLGEGSTFRIQLPRHATVQLSEAAVDAKPVHSTRIADIGDISTSEATVDSCEANEAPLILLVDDHPDMRLHLRRILTPRYRTVEAEDGPSALAAARQHLPDLIVCDVMMPGFDGVELARRLRADAECCSIPLLFLTARAGAEHAIEGLSAGADDFLAKPFDSGELLARVDALRAMRRRLQWHLTRTSEAPPTPAPTTEERWRERLDAVLAHGLADSRFGVDALAASMHMDRTSLFRRLKSSCGMSPSEYLREARLRRAHELLLQGAGNVTEVAYSVGFESLSSFARAFRQRHGRAPSEVLAGSDPATALRHG